MAGRAWVHGAGRWLRARLGCCFLNKEGVRLQSREGRPCRRPARGIANRSFCRDPQEGAERNNGRLKRLSHGTRTPGTGALPAVPRGHPEHPVSFARDGGDAGAALAALGGSLQPFEGAAPPCLAGQAALQDNLG